MQSDDPAVLTEGTEVSAKFKGGWCEAKIKKVNKSVKCKVLLKDSPLGTITVDDSSVTVPAEGKLEANQAVDVLHGRQSHKGVVQSVRDYSLYSVVFNDGDEKMLKRSQVCIKSARHFDAAATLDTIPLHHPETLVQTMLGRRQKRQRASSSSNEEIAGGTNRGTEEVSPQRAHSSATSPTPSTSSMGRKNKIKRTSSVTLSLTTPVKGISSTRSATRAIAALKKATSVEDDQKNTALELLSSSNSKSKSSKLETSQKNGGKKKKIGQTAMRKEDKPPSSGTTKSGGGKKAEGKSAGTAISTEKMKGPKSTTVEVSSKLQPEKEKPVCTPASTRSTRRQKATTTAAGDDEPPLQVGMAVVVMEDGNDQPHAFGLLVSGEEYVGAPGTATTSSRASSIPLGQVPIRNFQNGRYQLVFLTQLKVFATSTAKLRTDSAPASLKISHERASIYAAKKELPHGWSEKGESSQEKDPLGGASRGTEGGEGGEGGEGEDGREEEEKINRFVALFYKFQDDSGNPCNRCPTLGGRELNLYLFYETVQRHGGHKRVTADAKWRAVLNEVGIDTTPQSAKSAYLRHFGKFEAFMKSLGYSNLNDMALAGGRSSSRGLLARPTHAPLDVVVKRKADEGKEKEKANNEKLKEEKSHRSTSKDLSAEPSPVKSARVVISAETTAAAVSSSSVDNAAEKPKPSTDMKDQGFTTKSAAAGDTERQLTGKDGLHTVQKPKPKSMGVGKKGVAKKGKRRSEKGSKVASESNKAGGQKMPGKCEGTSSSQTTTTISGLLPAQDDRPKRDIDFHEGSAKTRTPSANSREGRTQSPQRGQSTAEERSTGMLVSQQDIGYNNANIFTRFYQGQKIHARHHLRFYDARVIDVRQPTLKEIAKGITNAYELSKITHQCGGELDSGLSLTTMRKEVKEALRNMATATKCFVHYLGWNSRYDEWLMLHKMRVAEKDERESKKSVEALVPVSISRELLDASLEWCFSSEGIASLARTHGHSDSEQQRPRRLSSSAVAAAAGKPAIPSTSSSTGADSAHSSRSPTRQPLHTLKTSSKFKTEESASTVGAGDKKGSSADHSGHSHRLSVQTMPLPGASTVGGTTFTIPHLSSPKAENATEIHTYQQHSSPLSTTHMMITGVYSAPPLPSTNTSKSSQKAVQEQQSKSLSTQKESASTSIQPRLPSSRSTTGLKKSVIAAEPSSAKHAPTEDEEDEDFATGSLPPPPAPPSFSPTIVNEQSAEPINLHQSVESTGGGDITLACQPDWKLTAVAKRGGKKIEVTAFIQGELVLYEELRLEASRGKPKKKEAEKSSTDEEDVEQVVHSDSSHAVRQRVLHRMEAQNLFASYSFVGLPEIEGMLESAEDESGRLKVLEERMQVIREIYAKYRGKLSRLERRQKESAQKKKSAAKDGKGDGIAATGSSRATSNQQVANIK